MSSPDSESLFSTISHGLPIPKLIKHIKHSFRERDFNEVQNILTDRENSMKMEIENLTRDRDSVKEELRLLKRTAGLAEFENSKVKEKLHENRRGCEDLEEAVAKLLEEKRVTTDREKRAEDRYDKLYTEMIHEKNKLISELNEKIKELRNKNLESERLAGVYQEKCKCFDIKIVKMGQEIEDLRHERSAATQTVEELRRKQLEANRAVDELRLKKLESDRAAAFNKSRLENLAPRIMKIEELLADMLNVKVGDLANLVGEMCRLNNNSEGGDLDFREFKGIKDSPGNCSTPDDAQNMVAMSPGRSMGMSNKGDKKLVESSTREYVAPPQVESNECKERQGSGARASGTQVMSGEGCFSKSTCPSSATGDIIEILDSDDETTPPGAALILNKDLRGNVGDNEMKLEKIVRSPSSIQRGKRDRKDSGEDFLENLISKRTRNMCTSHEDDNVSVDTQTPLQKFGDLNDEVSTDSDESCSDSTIIDLIASLTSNKHHRKWMHTADMMQAFDEDEELCMNAVCALYRQKIFAGKSMELSILSENEELSPADSMSGRALAEYLIDGNKELRPSKSGSEVKKQRPDAINQCRKLANIYVEKLFAIYCAGEDPFFSQT